MKSDIQSWYLQDQGWPAVVQLVIIFAVAALAITMLALL